MDNRRLRVAARSAGGLQPLTATEWLAYFRGNGARVRPIPWQRGAEVIQLYAGDLEVEPECVREKVGERDQRDLHRDDQCPAS